MPPLRFEHDFDGTQPTLLFEEYFEGETWAWGIFEDRFGKIRRSFKISLQGEVSENLLVLTEDFLYDDGEIEQRIWTIRKLEGGFYEGTAKDIVGIAKGQVVGNALHWQYQLQLPVGSNTWLVDFNDWMFLQPNDVLINKAAVSKWGFHVGTVTIFFSKQAPTEH